MQELLVIFEASVQEYFSILCSVPYFIGMNNLLSVSSKRLEIFSNKTSLNFLPLCVSVPLKNCVSIVYHS